MKLQKKVKLGDIANIFNGLPDTKIDNENNPDLITYNLIQPNHLGVYNDIRSASEIKRQSPVDDSYFIRQNDILLKRLNPDIANLVNEEMLNTTFSSNLFVIRLFKRHYPAYIACFLENKGLALLNSNIVGSVSAIKSISTKLLASLDIPDLEYKQQKAIGQIWLLQKKRRRLLNDLIIEDQRFMAAIINKLITGAKEDK